MLQARISRHFWKAVRCSLEEHKTTIYDYLSLPQEYEQLYTASADEFPVPEVLRRILIFMLNQACFDTYDEQQIYDFCCMRLENGAAVVRFKFTSQEAFKTKHISPSGYRKDMFRKLLNTIWKCMGSVQ